VILEHLWADRIDGALEDVFELQDEVTTRVVGAIEPSITEAEIGCAITAVARKLASILHRMWVSETDFHVGFGAKVTQRLRLKPAR
jgi:hypothetical protein